MYLTGAHLYYDLAYIQQIIGDTDNAISNFDTSAFIYEYAYGSEHVETIHSKKQKASALGKAGRLQESYDLFEDVLNSCRALFGPDSSEEATTLNQKGVVALNAHDFVLAADCFRESIRICNETKVLQESPLFNGILIESILGNGDSAFSLAATGLELLRNECENKLGGMTERERCRMPGCHWRVL